MIFEILHNGKLVDTRELREGSHKLGRATDCDVVLKSSQISKQHALIVIKGNKAAIVDLGSANGVFVNGILVRKQRIRQGDDIVIADFKIRIVTKVRQMGARRAQSTPMPEDAGNLAVDMGNMDFGAADPQAFGAGGVESEEAPQLKPQEKMMLLVDEKVLSPMYGMMKTVDWKILLFSVIGMGFLLSVGATIFSILPWGQEIATREALKRAHTVIGQLVRENYRVLATSNDYTRLSVAAGESEPGMLSISVVDPKANTIVAPAKLFNKSVSSVHYLLAIQQIKQEGKSTVDVPKGDNVFVVAQPIYLFSQQNDSRELAAIVLADFEIPESIHRVYEPTVRAALFAILLVLLAFFLLSKMVSYPIVQIHDQLDAALKGEDVNIVCDTKFPELENLSTVINFAVTRWKQASGEGEALSQDDSEVQAQQYIASVREFDKATSDGILVLDPEKKIIFVGHILEELIGLRAQYAVGQNISEAAKDAGFAGTVIDLTENVMQSLGESQEAELDINGVRRHLIGVGHKNSEGSVSFVLINVRIDGEA